MAKPDILSHKIIQLLQTHHLLTAQQLLEQLKKEGTAYNKTSVYRSLEKLLSLEQLCRHDFSGTQASYELHESHHDHVVCTSCGMISTVKCKLQNPVRIPGFSIDHHHLTFFGTCKSCRNPN